MNTYLWIMVFAFALGCLVGLAHLLERPPRQRDFRFYWHPHHQEHREGRCSSDRRT
jgi:hypothetical protein